MEFKFLMQLLEGGASVALLVIVGVLFMLLKNKGRVSFSLSGNGKQGNGKPDPIVNLLTDIKSCLLKNGKELEMIRDSNFQRKLEMEKLTEKVDGLRGFIKEENRDHEEDVDKSLNRIHDSLDKIKDRIAGK